MYFATVAWDTPMPSLNGSVWIRGAPHSGFGWLIFWIISLASVLISGRPIRRRLFQVH